MTAAAAMVDAHDTENVPATGPAEISVSSATYDRMAALAGREQMPITRWLDRAINTALDRAQAPQLVCARCRAVTPHLHSGDAALFSAVERTYACADCGTTRSHRVVDLEPEDEGDDLRDRRFPSDAP